MSTIIPRFNPVEYCGIDKLYPGLRIAIQPSPHSWTYSLTNPLNEKSYVFMIEGDKDFQKQLWQHNTYDAYSPARPDADAFYREYKWLKGESNG